MFLKLLLSSVLLNTYVLCYYTPAIFPNIHVPSERAKCIIEKSDEKQLFICDPDKVLQASHEGTINDLLKGFSQKTGCICDTCTSNQTGVKAYVAIAKNIYKDYQQTPEQALISMATEVRKDWDIDDCNDDLLIFMVTENKMFYTSVGARTKKYLTPDYRKDYHKNLKYQSFDPYNILSDAITAFRDKIIEVQKDMKKKPEEPVNKAGIIIGGVTGGIVAIVLVIILVVVFIKSSKMREGRLGSIRRDREKTDPGIKITPRSSLYEPVKTSDPDERNNDAKVNIDEDPPIDTKEQTTQDRIHGKQSEKTQKKSPKESKQHEVTREPKKHSKRQSPPPSPPKSHDSDDQAHHDPPHMDTDV